MTKGQDQLKDRIWKHSIASFHYTWRLVYILLARVRDWVKAIKKGYDQTAELTEKGISCLVGIFELVEESLVGRME